MMLKPDALRRRVEGLLADYIGCIDQEELERWPTFFTADGQYRITSRENEARGLPAGVLFCSGRGMLHDRVLALRRANIYEPHCYRHLVSGTRLVHQEPMEWRFHTHFVAIRTMQTGDMALFAAGLYDDLIVEHDGQLLFHAKTAICDASRIDTLLVIPL